MTNARFAALHGLPVAPLPFDDARYTSQIRALVTSGHLPDCRYCGGLPSAARWRDVPLRLRFANRYSPPFAPLFPLTDRRPKPCLLAAKKAFSQPMSPEEIRCAFEDAEKNAATLQQQYAQAAQSLGQVSSVLYTTKPYWVQLAAESGNNATIMSILESGKATVAEINRSLASIPAQQHPPLDTLRSVSLSASFFGSNTAATSSLVPLNGNTSFRVEAIPMLEFSKEKPLADRFATLDPALGNVCKEIWESLNGTLADPERSALFMIRQTWDHFFECLAPDSEVRNSRFWTKKDGDKPDLVTREERFHFAVDRHVKDAKDKALLLAACNQMLDLYQELNRAHKRGEIDKTKARRSLNSMYSWLVQWANALGI